jgi:carboxylesterase type B
MSHWVSISNSSIVAVNIQYRLGALGFLASSAVIADGDVNVGLFDQRAAFEWVRRLAGFYVLNLR